MINYDPKAWLRVSFSFGGTVIPRVLGRVVALAALTAGLWLLVVLWPGAKEQIFTPFQTVAHTLLGVALGLLIVFRNNCSYDRYWEGRKLWGSIVNSSRNLLRGASVYVGESRELANLVAAYVLALKQHLRNNKDLSELEPLLPAAIREHAASTTNPPSIIAYYMSVWIRDRHSEGKFDSITGQALEGHVRGLLDFQGGCERILRTPIPFAYAVHIKQLLMLYLITLPFILVIPMGWASIFAVAAISFGLLGIEEAGVEIEDPFGDDPNDLPIEAICATIGRDTSALAEAPKLAADSAIRGGANA